jgi:hypothetical protein
MSEDKKIEIEVPKGYELVQDGMNIKFVKIDERFLSWEEKDNKLTGYRVSNASDVYSVDNYDRNDTAMNIFATEAQAIGSRALSKLSQQLADFNEGWVPDWGERTGAKYCICSRFCGKRHIFVVDCFRDYPRFLALKTREDAEKFLEVNIDGIELAKDFI